MESRGGGEGGRERAEQRDGGQRERGCREREGREKLGGGVKVDFATWISSLTARVHLSAC